VTRWVGWGVYLLYLLAYAFQYRYQLYDKKALHLTEALQQAIMCQSYKAVSAVHENV
jgi:hypothetical protein